MLWKKIISGINPANLLKQLNTSGETILFLENPRGVPFGQLHFNVKPESLNINWLNLTDANLPLSEYAELQGLGTGILRAALVKARELQRPYLKVCAVDNYKLLHLINAKIAADAVYLVQENSSPEIRQTAFAEYPWLENRYLLIRTKNWLVRFEESLAKEQDFAGWLEQKSRSLFHYFCDGHTFMPKTGESFNYLLSADAKGRLFLQNKETGQLIRPEQLGSVELSDINADVLISTEAGE